ncbi:ImmA/IrrE family metallo-endopeptidase [Xanthomonas campestris pv. raphani]|uniref:ImmA/IrrE family metallo-endopeptidase n=1 Tax=Xanthomonas campestris TaxID=339 RepID=UPI0025A095A9|nr:ImmA/IrrE family metallo-endopeptidase [Xanthomonas campestris]MDM7586265.1 ImmA/IrrE family metallo-endopeptidase [Xanthomonas campestris]MDM7593527.1 ImmA/IrrE family metallo-endopeptidase [Xanthomonas campestris]MEA9786463.1 ImmA/IrrE family metallo-endopeptidase [Xanthomonas campestris pv. raphani]MEA9865641.1 ImmA/IrrE family metallo-endopeptidase [Xanthomonas campestris pv. raphani]
MDFDDFPLSPNRSVKADSYLEAYLEAQRTLRASAKHKDVGKSRDLLALTNQIYAKSQRGAALLRAHGSAPSESVSAWLSKLITISHWAVISGIPKPFHGIDMEFVYSIPRTSKSADGIRSLEKRLLAHGIILIHEAAAPGSKVDGCVMKLETGHMVIGMSLRYPRLDYYYFTLMHELGHIALHVNELDVPIIDDLDETEEEHGSEIEIEANRFARDTLIPRNEWRTADARKSLKKEDVMAFAQKIGVAPQIVAGRIRNERKRHDLFGALVHEVNIREILSDA